VSGLPGEDHGKGQDFKICRQALPPKGYLKTVTNSGKYSSMAILILFFRELLRFKRLTLVFAMTLSSPKTSWGKYNW